MESSLAGKIALVTGGGRGIGSAVVREFLKCGAIVYFNYHKNKASAEAVIESAAPEGNGALTAVQCSVTDADSIKAMVQGIRDKHGRVDILVNNAGITKDNFFLMMSAEEWADVIHTNLFGMFNVTKQVVSTMLTQKKGAIVNIASVAAIHGAPGQSNYSASKGGIIAFTKSLSTELAGKGIRVNSVLPGFIKTDMTSKMPRKVLRERVDQIPVKRLGLPQEIAQVVAFLASDQASYIVGQAIIVDGGLTRGGSG